MEECTSETPWSHHGRQGTMASIPTEFSIFFFSNSESEIPLFSLQSPYCSRLSSPNNSWASIASLSWVIFVPKAVSCKNDGPPLKQHYILYNNRSSLTYVFFPRITMCFTKSVTGSTAFNLSFLPFSMKIPPFYRQLQLRFY